MANQDIQLKGNLKLSAHGDPLVDVRAWVSRFGLVRQRATVTKPPTLLTGAESYGAGGISRQLVITFHSSQKAAEVWAILCEAIESDDALVDFEGTMTDDAVSSDNPKYSGVAFIPQLDSGPDVGSLRQQTITLPIVEWTTPAVV